MAFAHEQSVRIIRYAEENAIQFALQWDVAMEYKSHAKCLQGLDRDFRPGLILLDNLNQHQKH